MAVGALATVTITGTLGPDVDVTSKVLTNVTLVEFRLADNIIRIVSNGIIIDFDYDITATVTYTISGNTATITIA